MDPLPPQRLDLPEISAGQLLVRAGRLAAGGRTLAIAAAATLVCGLGWMSIAGALRPAEAAGTLDAYAAGPWARHSLEVGGLLGTDFLLPRGVPAIAPQVLGFSSLLRIDQPASEWFALLACLAWGVIVWAWPAAIITRRAALELVREERIGFGATLRFVRRRLASYQGAPWLPTVGLLLITVPAALLGLLARSSVGLAFAGIVWPLVLIGALAAAVLVIGLALGWPLLWAAISVDGGDAFDAVSRTYSYVFDSVLRFVGYVALAALVGVAGYVGISVLAAVTLHLALWTVSWGAGADWLNTVGDLPFGLRAITFWSNGVWLVTNAYLPSYVLTAGTAIYLLLRFRVDGAELDQLHFDEPPAGALPPVEQLTETATEAVDAPQPIVAQEAAGG
jgi:hypothetical protein